MAQVNIKGLVLCGSVWLKKKQVSSSVSVPCVTTTAAVLACAKCAAKRLRKASQKSLLASLLLMWANSSSAMLTLPASGGFKSANSAAVLKTPAW